MADLTVQDVARTGLSPSFASAAASGDAFANNGNTLFYVKNGDASAKTITIASQYSSPPVGTAQDDIAVSVPAGEERMIGPLPQSGYNDGDGKAQVTYDDVTSVTVAAISMGDSIQR